MSAACVAKEMSVAADTISLQSYLIKVHARHW